jgi:hypothetical protein
MLPFAHDTVTGTTPGAPSISLQRTPRSSSTSALRHFPIAPLHKILINGANIRKQLNSRRITANLFSNRKYFAVFSSVLITLWDLPLTSAKLPMPTLKNDSPPAPMLLSLR